MRLKQLLLGTVVASLLALAACGGGDDGDTEDFVAQADQICAGGTADVVELATEQGVPQSAEEDAAQTEQRVALQRDTTERLQALEAPDDAAADYDDFLSAREGVSANEEQYGELAKQGVPLEDPKVQQLDAAYYGLLDEADAAAERVGLQDCARQLPTDVEQQVGSEVEETLETGDPAFCTEKYTESFVQEAYGGLEECEKSESAPGDADPVTIEDVGGVEGVSAFVRFVPERGPEQGNLAQVNLVYEDGTYKRDSIVPIPPEE